MTGDPHSTCRTRPCRRRSSSLDRPFELRTAVNITGAPTSETVMSRNFLYVITHRLLQLPDAPDPKLHVRRPVGLVERLARRTDRGAHVGRVRIGRDTKHFLGGRVGIRKRAPAAATSLPPMNQTTSRSSSSAIPNSHSHSGQLSGSIQSNHNLNSVGRGKSQQLSQVERSHF